MDWIDSAPGAVMRRQWARNERVEAETLREWVENWGFYLFPRAHPDSPGYAGLLVTIRDGKATDAFAPDVMVCRLRDDLGYPEWVEMHEQPFFRGSRHVCPGPITLYDKGGDRVEFFTFGGPLEVVTLSGEAFYSLRSPAPVLVVTLPQFQSNGGRLALDTAGLLARQLAAWGTEQSKFQKRLGLVDPFQAYVAAIHTLIGDCHEDEAIFDAHFDLYCQLCQEKEWLQRTGQWPLDPPTMEQLLGPEVDAIEPDEAPALDLP